MTNDVQSAATGGAASPRLGRMSLWLFLAIFLYCGVWIFQGFDMTDEGYHLTNQMMFGAHATSAPNGMLWLTFAIGDLWLKLTDRLGLIGARLGWVVTMGLTGVVAFRTLAAYFPVGLSALSVFAVAVASQHQGVMVISQNNVSFLILLLAVSFLLAADRETDRRRGWSYSLASGLGFGLAIMSRFPLVLSLALLGFPPAVRRLCLRQRGRRPVYGVMAAILGVLLAVAGSLWWMESAGRMTDYVNSVVAPEFPDATTYSFKGLLMRYLKDGLSMLRILKGLTLGVLPWLLGVAVLCRRFNLRKWFPPLVVICGLAWWGQAVVKNGLWAVHSEYFLLLPAVCLAVAVVEGLVLWLGAERSEASARQLVLLVMSAASAVIIVAGTNNGLWNLKHGLWLLMPAAALALPETVDRISARFPRLGLDRQLMARTAAAVVVLFVLVSAGLRTGGAYRDARARWRLTTPIGVDRLQGVFTTSARARSTRQLFAELDKRIHPGEPMLCFGSIPMAYYVTRTVPALDEPWLACLDELSLRRHLDRMYGLNVKPRVVVRALTDTGDAHWGSDRTLGARYQEVLPEKEQIILRRISRLGYRPVWSNADFEIRERLPALPGGEGEGESKAEGRLPASP